MRAWALHGPGMFFLPPALRDVAVPPPHCGPRRASECGRRPHGGPADPALGTHLSRGAEGRGESPAEVPLLLSQ